MASQEPPPESGNSLPDNVKRRSPSPEPPLEFIDPAFSGLQFDPSLGAASFSTPSFADPNTAPANTESYGYAPNYLSPTVAQTLGPPDQNVVRGLNSFGLSFTGDLEQTSALSLQQGNYSNLLNSNQPDLDFSAYQNHNPNSSTAPEYNSSQLLDPQMHQRQGVNPADLVSGISSSNVAASPQLSPQDQMSRPQAPQQYSSSSSISPPSSAGPYYTPQHSRNTSLDPSSASYFTGHSHPDWQSVAGNPSFQSHRRTPSEVSEASSVTHSPFMSQRESFDGVENNPSPLLAAQNDPNLYDNSLGFDSFTLSDQRQQSGLSQGQSPYISPQLMPQQGADMAPDGRYISGSSVNPQYSIPPTDVYANETEEGIAPGDLGQASHMAPPSINVEFAPPAKDSSFGASKPATDLDSLSPPSMRKRSSSLCCV